MGSAPLGLGISLVSSRPPSWSYPSAIVDADFAGGRFLFAGRNLADKPAFLAAISGIEAGGAISIGPYIAPDATELLTNGDFSGGDTGWAATQTAGGPATGTVAAGEYTLTGNGADSPAMVQAITVATGHAYRGRGKIKRGASGALSPVVRFSSISNLGATNFSSGPNVGATSYVEQVMQMTPPGSATTMYFGMRIIANPANGTGVADEFSVQECIPFAGFVPAAMSGVIEATTPSAVDGNQVLWQTDDNAINNGAAIERNYIRLVWDASSHLRLVGTCQATAGSTTEQFNLDLGVVAASTAFRVAFSCAPNSFIASLGGHPALSDTSGIFPGAAVMRLGRSQTGSNNWNGTIERVTLFDAASTTEQVENLAADGVSDIVAAWGDSLTTSAGATGDSTRYPAVASALFTPHRAVANMGAGSETSTQIRTRFMADATLRRRTAWLWAGRNNYGDPATVKADIAAMIAALPHDRYLVGSILNGNYLPGEGLGGSNYSTITGLNAGLAALYGPRFVDIRGALINAADPVADAGDVLADIVPASLRTDNIHLNDAGYAVVAAAFKAANDAMGW